MAIASYSSVTYTQDSPPQLDSPLDRTYVTKANTFDEWRQFTNLLADDLTDLSSAVQTLDGIDTATLTFTNKTITSPVINTPTITGNTTFSDGAYDFNIASHDGSNGLKLAGTLVTSSAAELNKLDGATVTTGEINIIDGGTSATATTVADADRVVYNDAGTMKQVAVTDLDTYFSGTTKTLTNKTITSPTINTPTITGNTTFSDGAYDFNIASHDGSNGLKLAGTLVSASAAELNKLDGANVTTAEINIIDGGTAASSITPADADRVVYNDGGTMKQVALSTLDTHFSATTKTLTNKTIAAGSNTISGLTNSNLSGSAGITNANLANSSITVNGASISLGGSVSNLAVTTGNLSQFASTTSAQLAGIISNETGSGALVFGTSPTIASPTISGTLTLNASTLAGTAFTFEADDIANEDLDTRIPTSAAVRDYVDAQFAAAGTISGVVGGDGLTASGVSTVTLDVGEGTGITVSADAISTNDSEIVHDNLSGFVSNEHINHTSVSINSGNGLTGGGTIASSRTLAVGAGTGITVNADDVQLKNAGSLSNDKVSKWNNSSGQFEDSIITATSSTVTVGGNLTVTGTTTTVDTTNTIISDQLIELGNGRTGSPTGDAGIVIERGDSNNAFIGFDESADKFIVGTGTFTGASTGNLSITSGTLVAATFEGNLTGNVTGNTSGSSGSCTGNSATATTATNITASANNSTNETVYLTFVDGATGTQGIETDTALSYNPSSNTLTAGTFSGSGASLTSLNASNISSGTISDARLPASISSDITGNAATVTVADESSDTTCFPLFSTAATGSLEPKTGSNLTFNSSNGTLAATTFSGSGASLTSLNASNISSGTISDARLPASISSDITGNAATATTATNVTVADESSDTTCFPLFTTGASGNLAPKSGSNLTFNSSNGTLAATTFSGIGSFSTFSASGDAAFDTDTLFVDVSTDRVGINDSTPSYSLDVNGTARVTGASTFDGTISQNISGTASYFPGYHKDTFGAQLEDAGANGSTLYLGRDNQWSLTLGTSVSTNTVHSGKVATFYDTDQNGGGSPAVGAQVGSISITTSATAFNTSSDYRLKENLVEIEDGITRVKQLSPKRFNFIVDPDKTVDGFIAHEVSDVVPEAITGEKDAVDENGNPSYQAIDQSKLVPLLTAALQEAITKIEALETRVAALES